MTKISYIHGARPRPGDMTQAELKQRSRNAKLTRLAVDTANWSAGETLLHLKMQEMQARAEFFPDVAEYRAAYEVARDILYKGLHSAGFPFGKKYSAPMAEVMQTARRARKMRNPVSGFFKWSEKARTPEKGIGDPLVTQLDCDGMYPLVNPDDFPGQGWVEGHNQSQHVKRQKCYAENRYRELFNQHFEDISLWPLYKWLPPYSADGTTNLVGVVDDKRHEHRNFIDRLAEDSKIPVEVIMAWFSTGAVRKGIASGIGPYTPPDVIDMYKYRAGIRLDNNGFVTHVDITAQGEAPTFGIGGFPAFVVPLAIALVASLATQAKAFINIVKGEQNLFQAFKEQFEITIDAIANTDWGAEEGDFYDLARFLNENAGTDSPTIDDGDDDGGGGGDTKKSAFGKLALPLLSLGFLLNQ